MIATLTPRPDPATQLANSLQAFFAGEPTPAADVEPAPHETVNLQDPFWVDSQFPEFALAATNCT